jgi:hypothetical protein
MYQHLQELRSPEYGASQPEEMPLPQVYSVTMYVDEAAARADLQQAKQAGKLESDEGVCQALAAGAYTKALQVRAPGERSMVLSDWHGNLSSLSSRMGRWPVG